MARCAEGMLPTHVLSTTQESPVRPNEYCHGRILKLQSYFVTARWERPTVTPNPHKQP